jgi:hypothetical protein
MGRVAAPSPRKRMGRPRMDPEVRTVRASVALRRGDLEALQQAAEDRGVSMSSIVQDLVTEWLRRESGR